MTRFSIRAAVVAALLASISVGSAQATAVHDKAPTFQLDSVGGGKAGLKSPAGDVTVVNFWASWCGPCAIEFPNLNKLAAEYKDKGLKIFAINIDTDQPSADRFLTRYAKDGLTLTVLLDPKAKTAGAYAAKAMPSSYIVDGKGVVRFVHVGFKPDDPAQWRKEIDSLLSESK
jgi:cytochrome c biogenesis protein CcmG/thiol:disulfide interchange protein DsbE